MLVVLDACALISDYLMKSAAFEIIWRHGTDLKVRLAVPEVAYEDAVFHLSKEYQEAHSKLQKSIRTIERTSVEGIDIDRIPEMDPENPQKYRRYLQAHIEMMGEIVNPSEEVLRRVQERCNARRRPFSGEGDAGYKDAQVWETVLDLLRTTNEKVLFITADQHFLNQSKTQFHEHLLADLEEAGCTRRVQLFTTLSDLTTNRLLAKARRDRKLEQAYLNPDNPIFSIPDFLNSHTVRGMLQPVGLDPRKCHLPITCTRVSLRNFRNWEIKPGIEVRSLGGRKKLCIFTASAECFVHWREPGPEPHRMITTDEQDRLIAIEYLPERSTQWGKALRKCRFRMELVIDYKLKRWVSWSDELLGCSLITMPEENV